MVHSDNVNLKYYRAAFAELAAVATFDQCLLLVTQGTEYELGEELIRPIDRCMCILW